MITKEQYRDKVLAHKLSVKIGIQRVIDNLYHRGENHDNDKLEGDTLDSFYEISGKFEHAKFGSQEYENVLEKLKPTLDKHYAINEHHPQYAETKEEWEDILGYNGIYQVSNYGQVRSTDRAVVRMYRGGYNKAGKILRPYLTPKGYLRIQLSNNGVEKNHMVHRLVAEAFIENPQKKPEVNHKDGNKQNNNVYNLEWVTSSENIIHAYDTGLIKPQVKYIVKCVDLGIITEGTEKMASALRDAGYSRASSPAIWRCINTENAKHLDLTFEGYPIAEARKFSYVEKMTIMELIEMLIDWKSASSAYGDNSFEKSMLINKKRFEIDEQLYEIMLNTAKSLGYLD